MKKNNIFIRNCARISAIVVALQLFAFSQLNTFAQSKTGDDIVNAVNVMKGLNNRMTKQQATIILQKYADKGNSYAMNTLGIAYMYGIGVGVDTIKAQSFLDKSGKLGNVESYHNLGMMYKNGNAGVVQNFKKACQWFRKGVKAGSVICCYDLGFMLYKGIGCKQDYKEATKLFQQAADRDVAQALYMLGLCYRNGYGVDQNDNRASFYLNRASKLGYYDALLELKRPQPENYLGEVACNKDINGSIPAEMPNINVTVNDTSYISGKYKGFIVMYDWSGKYILGEKPISLDLLKTGNEIAGKLFINNGVVAIKGLADDYGNLKFTDSQMKLGERYTGPDGVDYKMDYAQLGIWPNNISGRLGLYSMLLREPERPMYIELQRDGTKTSTENSTANENSQDLISISPNPFYDSFSAKFKLTKDVSNVQARFFSSTGVLDKVINLGNLSKGENTIKMSPEIKSGIYVLNIKAGEQVLRTIISKGGDIR